MLDEMYPETPVPLDHRNPFELLIAVLMSAQTTDLKVNEVTPALFEAGPTPAAMAALDVDVIQSLIRYVGLAPTKAKNIKRLSEMLLEHHDGQVPATFEALEALPGVGHKTAGVVMAQAFGVPPSRLTPTSTGLLLAGDFPTGPMSSERSETSKPSFRRRAGTTCTCKSSSSDGSIALRDGMTCPHAPSAVGRPRRNASKKNGA